MRHYVCWNIQLASELIAGQPEHGQIDEVSELLRQFSCKNMKMSAQTYNACMLGHNNSPPIELFSTLKNSNLTSLPSSLGNSPAKSEMSANHTREYVGTYNLPPIELLATLKSVKLTSRPSSLGNSPAKSGQLSKRQRTCILGHTNSPSNSLSLRLRSVKLTSSPSTLGNLPETQVKMSANIQRMYAGTYNFSSWNLLLLRRSTVKLASLPSSLGNSPAKK